MKVLLLLTDLYGKIGGGETVYRHIIESSPDIEFTYFRDMEAEAEARRPANARALPLLRKAFNPPAWQHTFLPKPYQRAGKAVQRFAASASGLSFDIIDTPDYCVFGPFIKKIFDYYNVSFQRLVLALHGNISTSAKLNWRPAKVSSTEYLEYRQFVEADAVYGLSKAYIRQWQGRYQREVTYINPLHFAHVPKYPLAPWSSLAQEKTRLYCIGRMEKRKGNDLFTELVRWLPKNSYERALQVGSNDKIRSGRSALDELHTLTSNRDLNEAMEFPGPYDWSGLEDIYINRSLVILPVRYDSLNLVALDALLHGCPTAISDRAGVCEFLDSEFPSLPYIKIPLGNIYTCVKALTNILENYDVYRAKLHQALNEQTFKPGPLDMRSIYNYFLEQTPSASQSPWLSLKVSKKPVQRPGPFTLKIQAANAALSKRLQQRARRIRLGLSEFLKPISSKIGGAANYYMALEPYFKHLQSNRRLKKRYRKLSEDSEKALDHKASELKKIADRDKVGRRLYWVEAARLEEVRGNELISSAYRIRLMRSLGQGREEFLRPCLPTLERNGYQEIAQAARLMYGTQKEDGDIYYHLCQLRNQLRTNPASNLDYEILEDQRFLARPKVSVIVSLYNAAPKLNFFLSALSQQTLFEEEEAELIIQDSHSPRDEKRVLDKFLRRNKVSVVYGRSKTRETIQSAWNRGISLAKAPYLVFLGVDEGLYPEALTLLAQTLDRSPMVDWVMADSLIMNVDSRGVLQNDCMRYRREGATKDHVYLETCYLSWVGGMYRKSIHDRCGYYDASFRGAGDTEFKNRVLPQINVSYLPGTLGLFFNYPEERTTASAMAELEDLRAWYIHRSLDGVRYAYEHRPTIDIIAQIFRSLGYRKSYCGHISTDFDYGLALSEYCLSRENITWLRDLRDDLLELQAIARSLDGKKVQKGEYFSAMRQVRRLESKHKKIFKDKANPSYALFNDNRYEQHYWIW